MFLMIIVAGLLFSLTVLIFFWMFVRYKVRQERRLTQYLCRINSGVYELPSEKLTEENSSVLSSEIYKTTIMLKEQSERSHRDKLALKDSLSDMTGGYNFVIQMLTYGRLLLEFIILFYIAYAVIRLIMRSRNSYYSTLRILGATKSNTDSILRVELLLMMLIAYGVDIAFVVLVKKGYLKIDAVNKLLYYLTPVDYVVLAVLLLLMSLLIAARYSRKIFTKSAMKAFREEA
jgi:hypothetical protein